MTLIRLNEHEFKKYSQKKNERHLAFTFSFESLMIIVISHQLAFTKDFVFVSESMGELFGCLGTDLSFMVHKRSLSLSLLCAISYHCRQTKRISSFL